MSNFLVGVAVARIAGPVGLGGFSLGYGCWLVVASLHRSLVTDPMAIENDAAHADVPTKLRQGLSGELTLAVAAACLLLPTGAGLVFAGQRAFGVGLLSVAPWLPFLVVQDYWRWVAFMTRRPGKALVNDSVFNVVFGLCAVIVFFVGIRSLAVIVAAWGLGAVAGSLFGLWQFSVHPAPRGGVASLRSRWHMSKWLAGNSLTNWGANQASTLLAGFILGPAGLGGLRSASTLVTGPTLVLIQAGGSIGLPEASRGLAERGWPGLRKVAIVVTAAGVASIALVGAVVIVMGRTLLRVIYGEAFAKYWPAADLYVLATLISAFGLGSILILKATRRSRLLFRVQVIALIVSMVTVPTLAILRGVTGAAAAATISSVASLSGLLWYGRVPSSGLPDATTKELHAPESDCSDDFDRPAEIERR